MRCGLVCALALLIFVPAAAGAAPLVTIQATPIAGAAPLHVTFSASGGATAYHWDFGDGAVADGQTAEHTYAAGRWTATLTSKSADGAATSQTVQITASGLTLSGLVAPRYDRKVAFRGAIVPAERNVSVALEGPSGRIAKAKTRSGRQLRAAGADQAAGRLHRGQRSSVVVTARASRGAAARNAFRREQCSRERLLLHREARPGPRRHARRQDLARPERARRSVFRREGQDQARHAAPDHLRDPRRCRARRGVRECRARAACKRRLAAPGDRGARGGGGAARRPAPRASLRGSLRPLLRRPDA